jgi:hypothetical protein
MGDEFDISTMSGGRTCCNTCHACEMSRRRRKEVARWCIRRLHLSVRRLCLERRHAVVIYIYIYIYIVRCDAVLASIRNDQWSQAWVQSY